MANRHVPYGQKIGLFQRKNTASSSQEVRNPWAKISGTAPSNRPTSRRSHRHHEEDHLRSNRRSSPSRNCCINMSDGNSCCDKRGCGGHNYCVEFPSDEEDVPEGFTWASLKETYPYEKMYGDVLHYKEDVDRLVKKLNGERATVRNLKDQQIQDKARIIELQDTIIRLQTKLEKAEGRKQKQN